MSRRCAALVLILALGLSGCSTASTTSPVAASSRTQPAQSNGATRTPTPTPTSALATAGSGVVSKVLVFIVENHSLGQMKSQMPFTFGLAQRFGYATNYTAIQHPSLPNYIAIAGGQTYGITNDDNPSTNPVRGTSVFGQAIASGKTAAVFADGMPQNCATNNGGSDYAVKHNPWVLHQRTRRLPEVRRACRSARRGDHGRGAAQRRDGGPQPLQRRTRLPARHRGHVVQGMDDQDL